MILECNLPCTSYIVTATTGNSYDPALPGVTRVGFKIPVEKGKDYDLKVTLKNNN